MLLLFHNALKWVLVLAGEIHDLCHFGLGDLVGEHAALADAVLMDVEHDAGRVLARLVEEALEDEHDPENVFRFNPNSPPSG